VLEQQQIAGNWLGGGPSTSRAASTSLRCRTAHICNHPCAHTRSRPSHQSPLVIH
jgi:hypothetical protein